MNLDLQLPPLLFLLTPNIGYFIVLYLNFFFFSLYYIFWMEFPGGSMVKNPPANAGDVGSIPGTGRSPGGGNGNPLQYSCLENPMDRGACQATVHGVTKSWIQLSDFTFIFMLNYLIILIEVLNISKRSPEKKKLSQETTAKAKIFILQTQNCNI